MRVLVGGRGVLCCKIQFLYYFREGNASSEECDELNIKVKYDPVRFRKCLENHLR